MAFGIIWHHQALCSAWLQIQRKTFEEEAWLSSSIMVKKLEQAQIEVEKHLPISNPAVHLLRKHIHTTGSWVMASDQAWYQLWSQIWSTSISLNPPSLWITINSCDLHDPIAQVFCGEEINLNYFLATAGPDKASQAWNITSNPHVAVKFFHFMIKTILVMLFQVKATPFKVKSKMGIFGQVAAYFGVVESQGCGSLHLHLLVWLKGAPTSQEMHDLLANTEFKAQVLAYIQANLHAYVPGLESAESIKKLPDETEIAYPHPINPNSSNYDQQLTQMELCLAHAKQVHTCELCCCLVPYKCGYYQCKWWAPFEIAQEEFIDKSGQWKPRQLYAYMNGWNFAILLNGWCNNDAKLLTNGVQTQSLSFYTTSYVTKKQGRTHSISAVMAKGYICIPSPTFKLPWKCTRPSKASPSLSHSCYQLWTRDCGTNGHLPSWRVGQKILFPLIFTNLLVFFCWSSSSQVSWAPSWPTVSLPIDFKCSWLSNPKTQKHVKWFRRLRTAWHSWGWWWYIPRYCC